MLVLSHFFIILSPSRFDFWNCDPCLMPHTSMVNLTLIPVDVNIVLCKITRFRRDQLPGHDCRHRGGDNFIEAVVAEVGAALFGGDAGAVYLVVPDVPVRLIPAAAPAPWRWRCCSVCPLSKTLQNSDPSAYHGAPGSLPSGQSRCFRRHHTSQETQ